MQFRAVKGMNDVLPGEIERWHRLERQFRRIVDLHGFSEVRVPVVESTALFVRSIGESTDIVEKEMFTFARGDESLTLRPEGTAGAARAYVEHKQHAKEPVSRWYYLGPMFRAERPQRGRYRQFWQAGCEILGDPGPVSDAELIDMLCQFFRALEIEGLEVAINSIGGPATRERHRAALLDFLRPKQDQLSEHARARLETNPLRILDSKDARDRAAVVGAPSILELLDAEDRAHWEGLCRALDLLATPYVVESSMVRGLDYYSRTAFEIRASSGGLGAQNTLAGGGRYDAMIESLGGPSVPAIGFAMGLERILLAMPEAAEPRAAFCYLAPIGAQATESALVLARDLRLRGVRAELDARGNSLKSMLRRADALGARLCVVVGEAELERQVVQLKDLAQHSQTELPVAAIVDRVIELLRAIDPSGSGAEGAS
jgi:histidyl-tRNA synthetase